MKKSNIAFLFQKHVAKKVATQTAPPIPVVDEELSIPIVEDPLIVSVESGIVALAVDEGTETPTVVATDTTIATADEVEEEEEEEPPLDATDDVDSLEHDPGLRSSISSFDVNEQDSIRRRYILKGPCHLYAYNYPSRKIYGKDRRFSFLWFQKYHWIEYSVEKDAAYCFLCYLFGKENGKFITEGWNNWNVGSKALDKHESSTLHKFSQEKYNLFVQKGTKIDAVIVKVSEKDRADYRARLIYSLRCLRFLLHQGLASRGHDETEQSNNRGNFLELLNWLARNNEEVNKVVLKNAPGNCILTSPRIQKQIIRCCSEETTRSILKELGDDYYAILADECSDISHKEQLAVCLRYVDKRGSVCERFLGVVHVPGTTSLELKTAIVSLLTSHHLTLSSCRGQGYDGASNMKGEVKGLKTLIMKESPSAYYVHCFAHQLQLVLVAVAKGDVGASTFFAHVSRLLNIVGVSCKRHDMLRDVRARKLKKALELGEIESGSGLNQEMGLARPGDTRWGSHYRTVLHIIDMYPTIREVLITIGKDPTQRDDWPNIHAMVLTLESFEFVFNAHLMLVILGYTNELSQSLQKRDQDIVNAMTLVGVAKRRFQQLRSDGWEDFLEKVKSFCIKYSIDIPAMDSKYEPHGRSHRFYPVQTIDDHYRREVFIGIIDRIHQELENRFDQVSRELLICMSALSPSNSFASFDAQKILKLATFYPKDISSSELRTLEIQLGTYIEDVKMDVRFEGLNTLGLPMFQILGPPLYTWQEKSRTVEVEEDEEPKEGEEATEGEKKKKTVTEKYWDWELANETKPIWMRNPKEIENTEYNEFYKKTFNEFLDPLAHTHFTTEGEVEFRSVLYVPGMAPLSNEEIMNPKTKNIRLYVKRVFISDDFDGELFPRYLSFVKGVVDSNDLPLNVSREILQESRIVRIMRKRLVRKTFDMFEEIAEKEDKEDYKKFWESFGKFIKLGCIEDTGNHKRLAPLLRFHSSKNEGDTISLDQYVESMPESQKAIYYIATDSLQSAKTAPFLEKLVQKDIEVLYLIEPIDEVAIQNLQTYKEKKFVDISKEDLELGDEEEETKETKQEFTLLCDWVKQQLGDKVAKVQISKRLSSSPCVLVSGKFGWSANMERLMKAQTLGDTSSLEFMRGRRIFEINPDHPIIKDLSAACKNEPDSTEAKRAAELLYEAALISSGYTPESPAELGGKIYEMMAIALGGRWGRSDTEKAEASMGEASAEADSSEGTVTEVIEPSEVRPESDPWRD